MTQNSRLTAGIDTGKEKLDVAVHGHTFRLTVGNAKKGWARIATELTTLGVTRVGIEATGGYVILDIFSRRLVGWSAPESFVDRQLLKVGHRLRAAASLCGDSHCTHHALPAAPYCAT